MRCALIAATAALLATGTFAQAPAPAAHSTLAAAASSTTTKTTKARTPISLDCSKQADTKSLHGKERKKFRSECMKSAKA